MKKRFATSTVLIFAALGIIVTAGGGYGVYKYNEIQKENIAIRAELDKQKDVEMAQLKAEIDLLKSEQEQISISTKNEAATTTDEVADSEPESNNVSDEVEVRTVVEERIVYVPEPTPQPTPEPAPIEVPEEDEPDYVVEEEQEVIDEVSPITIIGARQTAYPDGYGGVYGSYDLTIRVKPQSADIYIPLTTNDSLGTGQIGFLYEVNGQEFRGMQDSEVSDCTNFNNNLCKFKVGQDKDIKVTVWLYPDKDNSGNYSVNFKTVNYEEGGVDKSFTVNRETATLNLFY